MAGETTNQTPGLRHRFAYHKPDAARGEEHSKIRNEIGDLAEWLDARLPPGREKALVITHLEEAMFWANAAVARQQQ